MCFSRYLNFARYSQTYRCCEVLPYGSLTLDDFKANSGLFFSLPLIKAVWTVCFTALGSFFPKCLDVMSAHLEIYAAEINYDSCNRFESSLGFEFYVLNTAEWRERYSEMSLWCYPKYKHSWNIPFQSDTWTRTNCCIKLLTTSLYVITINIYLAYCIKW